jgi:MFS superfamily sulfate permease-like transporter
MLVGATVAGMAAGDPARWADIAALTALVVAVMCVLAWALRLSSLVDFISETILLGFKAGAALTIAMTQLPKLFGVKGGGEHFFERIAVLAGQLPDTNVAVLAFGLVALALLLAGEKLAPGRPVALAVVVVSIVALSVTPLGGLGFSIVGELPKGLPDFRAPELRLRDADGVIPLAFACLLLAYVEGVSAARTLAQKNGCAIDPRQELLGLGAANLAAAFSQGYPVAGGLSQSSLNDKAGAKTPLALLYFNVEHVQDTVWSKVRPSPAPVRLVVCDLSATPNVDVAGARMLAKLHAALQSAGIAFRLAGAHAAVRDILRAEGLEERAGYFGRRITAVDVVDEFEGFAQPAGSGAGKVIS